jgi:hypothetical protein
MIRFRKGEIKAYRSLMALSLVLLLTVTPRGVASGQEREGKILTDPKMVPSKQPGSRLSLRAGGRFTARRRAT